MVVIIQIICGHQFFVARSRAQHFEQREEFGMKLEKAFRNQEKIKFERAKSGDPAFLLAELERAHKSLKKVIDKDENTRGRANTA